MKTRSLKKKILSAFTAVIVLLAASIFALGWYVVRKDLFEQTQLRVIRSLDSARLFYEEEINRIGASLQMADLSQSDDLLRDKLRVHYFYRLKPEQAAAADSEIVRAAASSKQPVGGSRIIGREELERINRGILKNVQIEILPTEKARPTTLKKLETAMAKEYALPILNADGQLQQVVYGGRIINQDFYLVDRIRKLVFGDETFNGIPIGTVTIFQDDVRISTNVLDDKGRRAIGTRISAEVYEAVVEQGQRWLDRAFVVKYWYRSAYEPIRNINNVIIGILYVGILEEPYNAMAAQILMMFIIVILLASALAFVLAFILAGSISRPLTVMRDATQRLSQGELGHLILSPHSDIEEIHQLARAFNDMSVQLEEREVRLQENHQKLTELNKSYLDLLGFVAHELKGLLSSAVINAYSLRDGLLGLINFKQKKAVDSICRNLDYLDATVKKFLNLSRIERGNLEVNKTEFCLRNVFEAAIDTFAKQLGAKRMSLDNKIDAGLKVRADMDLMMIVANNLVNNAIKYGSDGGQIELSSQTSGEMITIEVYNDSRPIAPDMMGQLFKKFSRLNVPEKKSVKGTGLGLYITKQIVEAHGGTIWVQPREHGNSFIFTIHKE
ncbi:MAG TPA: cache domain-containing protein [Anaerohalosphaeraceae bacterium]|nr:cache domain-containing protein [Anaerohalosphaeraceae bacterium]HPC65596.1 cache domain-containing protein [Anaerohalosphaeraceae bacterium]HRS72458.1 cache domain-containing protein [Anaerohalosphaeraceae bacterium]HRV19220.1 cache domain-containing protein [Anaerohalosphaeraceae bacterium]